LTDKPIDHKIRQAKSIFCTTSSAATNSASFTDNVTHRSILQNAKITTPQRNNVPPVTLLLVEGVKEL
jgi:hypothetical protein